MKCPINNFKECDTDCAWYLPDPKCCSIIRLNNLCSNVNMVELKAIERHLSSIDDTLKRFNL